LFAPCALRGIIKEPQSYCSWHKIHCPQIMAEYVLPDCAGKWSYSIVSFPWIHHHSIIICREWICQI
jgi:hypothetical protein